MTTSTPAATVVDRPADLLPLTGKVLGTSQWRKVTQRDVDQFAEATGDHQWIHVDVERASQGRSAAPSHTVI